MTRRLVILSVFAVMILFSGCGGPNRECPSCTQLSSQNSKLLRQITEKDQQIERLRSNQGYLGITAGAAFLFAIGLLAVGIAIGVKIKDEIITLKDVNRADKSE